MIYCSAKFGTLVTAGGRRNWRLENFRRVTYGREGAKRSGTVKKTHRHTQNTHKHRSTKAETRTHFICLAAYSKKVKSRAAVARVCGLVQHQTSHHWEYREIQEEEIQLNRTQLNRGPESSIFGRSGSPLLAIRRARPLSHTLKGPPRAFPTPLKTARSES